MGTTFDRPGRKRLSGFNLPGAPLLLGVLLVALVAIMWLSLDRHRDEDLRGVVKSEAEFRISIIDADFRARIAALQRIVERWTVRRGTPRAEFLADAKNLMQDLPGFQALEWVDRSFHVRWIEPLKGNEAARDLNLALEDRRRQALEKARDEGIPAMTSPIDLVQGGKGLLIYFPIYLHDEFDGFLLAVIRATPWLEHVLGREGLDPDVVTTISIDDQDIFARGEGLDSSGEDWASSASTEILDHRFVLRVVPSQVYLANNRSNTPEIMLLLGSILSVLIVYVSLLYQRSYRSEKAVASTNLALSESEHRFRDFAESASDWFWEMGPDLAFTYGSDRFYEITGWQREEVYGRGREFLVHPELEDLASEKWQDHFAVLERHEVFADFQYTARTKQGMPIYFSLSGVPVHAADGSFLGYRGTGSDITEKRLAEDARHESEEKYRSIFDNAQVGLIRARISDGRPLDANERLAEILGYRDREDAINNHREDNHWAHQSERDAWIAEGEKNGFVRNFDGTLLRKDGSTVYIRSSATFYPEQGYIDVVMLDQTEQKLAENALRENEKRYLEMFNRAQVGLARKRISDGKLLEANERIAEIYGYESREEMLVEIDPASHWLDTASREEVMAEGPQSGGSYEIEAQHVRKDGATIWVRLSTNYFPELDYVEITNVDITEQKLAEQALHESEDRYRALSDLTSEGVAILEDGVIVEANQAFARMYGYTVSELVGKPVLELTIPEHSQEVADRMKENRSDTYESVSFRKDGSKIPIEIKAAPFVYKGRQMRVSRMRDLTEAHKAAAAVRDSEERLRQAQKIEAVGQLTGGIAHDFNNILAAVIGNLDLVKDDTIADLSDREAIETALDAALRGAELTHRLLAFSRQQALDARDTQINEILPRFLQLATRTIGANIAVETKLADGLDRTMIDVGQLENALLNLVINARDAMPEGGRLTIETANQVLTEDDTAMYEDLQPGDYVMVAVGDDGCGMPGEVREKAFEPFYTTKDVGAGSGLGLSMVFGFARQSGGQVMIDSEEGKGTRVRVYLPRLRPGASVEHPVEEVEQGKLEGKETILVVEDESDVLAYLVRALGGLGYTVLQAEDGPTALEVMAVCGSIDLLLTDVILPRGMNGRDVANAFRARNPGAAVLYSSGYTRDVLDDRGQLDDGVMLINKPFRPRALARQVREILDSRK